MTDNLKCPFCGAELEKFSPSPKYLYCPNSNCEYWAEAFTSKTWQALIDGKKAQRQLRTVKDRCVHKIKAKDREIANYLNGLHVRNVEIENLQTQLQKAHAGLYCGHCVKTAEISKRWADAIFFAKNFIGHGINSKTANYSESNCRWALDEINKILSGITSITKQEK